MRPPGFADRAAGPKPHRGFGCFADPAPENHGRNTPAIGKSKNKARADHFGPRGSFRVSGKNDHLVIWKLRVRGAARWLPPRMQTVTTYRPGSVGGVVVLE